MKSLGIDLSTSATGLVVLQSGPVYSSFYVALEREIKIKKLNGVARATRIVLEAMQTVHDHKPDVIVLEGYGFSMQHPSSIVPLVELGGLLRFMLVMDGFAWLDPRPAELKKFVTGKGNAPKDQVMMHVLKRWGHTSLSNNTADAYGCAAMGMVRLGAPMGATKEMQAIAKGLELRTN